jgi:DNA-binding NarL/FixJ family response regulator
MRTGCGVRDTHCGYHLAAASRAAPPERSAAARTARFPGVCHDCDVTTTILIVDDHPSFRASARAILEADGFQVVGEVEDGAGAIDAVSEKHPDVLLLDVQLPDMNGFEVCTEILARQNGSAPQVVIVSSRDACDFGSLIEASGARGFIAKAELSGEAVTALLR